MGSILERKNGGDGQRSDQMLEREDAQEAIHNADTANTANTANTAEQANPNTRPSHTKKEKSSKLSERLCRNSSYLSKAYSTQVDAK